ncbi:MAG: prepilin-type N-terminal cleavage/methylation domain-containing protein, partial [Opitutales bacterium]
MKAQNKKGFTLVEIMIVVVIIGLLAAMAIPAFQKVRESSIAKTLVNDGRQIGSAAQQYFMENGVSTINVSAADGEVSGGLTEFVNTVGKDITIEDFAITTAEAQGGVDGSSFVIDHALGTVTFNNEGKPTAATGDLEDD